MKLEVNNRRKTKEKTWTLDDILLKNQFVKGEIKSRIKKNSHMLKKTKIETQHTKSHWMQKK